MKTKKTNDQLESGKTKSAVRRAGKETIVVPVIEIMVFKLDDRWHLSCGFPLEAWFHRKSDAVKYARRIARRFIQQRTQVTAQTPAITDGYRASVHVMQVLRSLGKESA